jgi:hypothetical protein
MKRPLSNLRQIYLLHVPKTAGLLVLQTIRQWFSEERIAANYSMPSFAAYQNKDLVACHYGLVAVKFLKPGLQIITAVRRPKARVVSQLLHATRIIKTKRLAGHSLSEIELLLADKTFSEVMHDGVLRWFFSDIQTRFLGDKNLFPLMPSVPAPGWWAYDLETRGRILHNAKNTIRNSLLVHDKNIPLSLDRLADFFGEIPYAQAGSEHINASQMSVGSDELELLVPDDLVQYDEKLYAYATDVFLTGQPRQRKVARPRTLPLNQPVDFSRYIKRSGFSRRERFGEKFACWVGNTAVGTLIFENPGITQDLNFCIAVANTLDFRFIRDLSVVVNGHLAELERQILSGREAIFLGVVPGHCLRDQSLIDFNISTGGALGAPPPDERALSVLISSLEFWLP